MVVERGVQQQTQTLELIAEAWGSGSEGITGTTHTITMADGASDAARAYSLTLTGSITALNTVTLAPNTVNKTWVIQNSSGYAVSLTQGTGANVVIPNGGIKMVVADGAGSRSSSYRCTRYDRWYRQCWSW